MAFDGALLNRPLGGVERPISTALAFAYAGVFPRAAVPVLTPNADGSDDVQTLTYKLVRPSTVALTLTAPDGSAVFTQSVEQPAGTFPVPFPPDPGAAVPEGTWKLAATATDELGQQSAMTASFIVDDTALTTS